MKVFAGGVVSRLLGLPVLAVAGVVGAVYLWTVSYPAFERDVGPSVELQSEPAKTPVAEKPTERPKGPEVRLGVIPKLKLLHSTAATASEADGIRRLIGRLARAWARDLDGKAWALFPKLAVMPLFDFSAEAIEQLDPSLVVAQLVKLGPKALPFLLDALEDTTPASWALDFKMRQNGYSSVLCRNPVHPREVSVLEPWFDSTAEQGLPIRDYTPKVGDFCFEVIGAIVGRPYKYFRPVVGFGVVNFEILSPVENVKLRRQMRESWSSKDAGQRLFESLLIDYATRPVFDSASGDGGRMGSSLQANAAARLLSYFPEETAELIAGRLDMLDVDGGSGTNRAQLLANGVIAADFIKAVAWCDEPRIRAALERLVERTTDAEIIRAARRGSGPDRSKS